MIFSETAICQQKMFLDSCTRPFEGQLIDGVKVKTEVWFIAI